MALKICHQACNIHYCKQQLIRALFFRFVTNASIIIVLRRNYDVGFAIHHFKRRDMGYFIASRGLLHHLETQINALVTRTKAKLDMDMKVEQEQLLLKLTDNEVRLVGLV